MADIRDDFITRLLKHGVTINDLLARINDLEVLVDNLRVQLSTHHHGTLKSYR